MSCLFFLSIHMVNFTHAFVVMILFKADCFVYVRLKLILISIVNQNNVELSLCCSKQIDFDAYVVCNKDLFRNFQYESMLLDCHYTNKCYLSLLRLDLTNWLSEKLYQYRCYKLVTFITVLVCISKKMHRWLSLISQTTVYRSVLELITCWQFTFFLFI